MSGAVQLQSGTAVLDQGMKVPIRVTASGTFIEMFTKTTKLVRFEISGDS
jgi:hypothetical protein